MVAPKPGDLVLGGYYLSVICGTCKKVIPTRPYAGEVYIPSSISSTKTRIGCPFCGSTLKYDYTELQNRILEEMPPTAQ